MKNPLTPGGIEPVTFQFVAQHLNHCATAVPPYIYVYIYIYRHTHSYTAFVIEKAILNETATTECVLYCLAAKFSMCVWADTPDLLIKRSFYEHSEDKA